MPRPRDHPRHSCDGRSRRRSGLCLDRGRSRRHSGSWCRSVHRRRRDCLGRGQRLRRLRSNGLRCRSRSGRWSRSLDGTGGEQPKGIDVAVRVGRDPDAEVDVWRGRDGVGALSDDADDCSLGDLIAAADVRRAELQQGDRVAVGCLDRDRTAAVRDRADERDGTRRGRPDRASERGADVDAAVLAAGVDVGAESERAQDLPVGRPRPGRSGRRDGERRQDDRGNEDSPHRKPPLGCRGGQLPSTLAVVVSGFSTILHTKRSGKCAPAGRRRRRPGGAARPPRRARGRPPAPPRLRPPHARARPRRGRA